MASSWALALLLTGTVQVPFLGDRTLQRTITVAARESVVVQGVGQDAWRLTINDLTNLGGGAVTNLTTTEWYRPRPPGW